MGNSAKRDVRSKERTDRIAREWELRKGGLTIRQIAPLVGVSPAMVGKDLKGYADRVVMPLAEETLKMELDRLDRLTASIWAKATAQRDVLAIDRLLRIMDMRAKYLGLYKPDKVALEGKDGGPIRIEDVPSLTDEQLRTLAGGHYPAPGSDGGGG
jgi:predicted transcriptional regulator